MAKRGKATSRSPARGGARRVRGMGISLRIAVAFVCTIAALMALGGFVIYSQSSAALDEAVDSFGVSLARTLALQDIDVWRYKSGTYDELRDGIRGALRHYPAWLQADAGVVKAAEPGPPDRERLKEERRAIRALDSERKKTNARRLEGITAVYAGDERIDVDVIDVFIFDQNGRLIAKANPARADFQGRGGYYNFVAVGSNGTAVETATEIQSGMVTLGGRRLPGRSFTQPIYAGRQKVGKVQLVISENRVAARKQRLALSIVGITMAMLLAGVLVSFLIARALAAPLQHLMDAVDAVARGRYDRRVHGHTRDEIGVLALSVNAMQEALREAEKDQSLLANREREMALVAELRRNLLPNETPEVDGFELQASYRPTSRVGGNYYDFLRFADGRLGILIADTAGEGVIAGFTMNLFRGYVHAEREWSKDPVDMLCRVNRHLAQDIKKGVYVTAFLVVVDPGNLELQLINAGHLPVLKWSGAEKKLRVAGAEGVALGLDPGPIFEERLKATRLTLEKGDRVVLYTEGVYRIQSADEEELGEIGFNKLVAKNAPMHSAAFMNLLERGLEKYREDGPETGDYTVITLKAV